MQLVTSHKKVEDDGAKSNRDIGGKAKAEKPKRNAEPKKRQKKEAKEAKPAAGSGKLSSADRPRQSIMNVTQTPYKQMTDLHLELHFKLRWHYLVHCDTVCK